MKRLALFPILLALPAFAVDQYSFRVAFPGDVAAEEISAQDYAAAIKVLEALDPNGNDGALTMLCGLYIIDQQLATAYSICNAAVATDQSYEAYNNRGVLRVHLKNMQGALNDFNRAKQVYLNSETLADVNHAEAMRYAEDRASADMNALIDRVGTAEAEELQ